MSATCDPNSGEKRPYMADSAPGSASDSDVDSLTEEMDQIGRFNLPSLSSYLNTDNLPSLSMPGMPNMPNLPNLPNLSGLSAPSFDLTEMTKYISQYVQNATSGPDAWARFESRSHLVNSVKTAVATRIQMNTFLTDLSAGNSLQAALARLQPITELIHEAVTLPADESDEEWAESDENEDFERDTEPVGVAAIVNREQPFVSELVLPETAAKGGVSHSLLRGPKKTRFPRVIPDETGSNTDLDTVDELTHEEAEVLTHLDSLDDFFKEDLLRRKIQRIQAANLSQHSKNKLVTKLMMGNYYKYINEKLHREQENGGEAGLKQGGDESGPAAGSTDEFHHSSRSMQDHEGEHDNSSEIYPNSAKLSSENSAINDVDVGSDAASSEEGDDEVVLTEADTKPTFHSETLNILGCPHYQRNCKLECPTCLKWYPCRFCHDAEVHDHKLARASVRHILCMKCNTPQVPDTNYCVHCEDELANYFCLKCVLYDNDASKDIYHCDKCGICRLGLGLSKDYFHCDTCNICLSIDLKEHHKCVSNTTHCNCPICNEYLFTSVSKVVFMKCGHSIHQSCYDEMIKHSYKCPICKKTVVNTETQFRILDQEIRQSPLPAPYDKWRCIISCNDCKGKSSCAYHVMGLKCRYCASYNTNQLKLIKPEEAGDEKSGESDEEDEEARISSMRLIKTNLGSNFLIDEQTIDSSAEPTGGGYARDDGRDADSAYDGDFNDEDAEDDDMSVMVNMKRLTSAVLGDRNVDATSISAMFQNFINATIMDGEDVVSD
ncbi:hypothetical protein OXX79_007126 [Metschnikowia pulcherrima]